MLEDHFDIASRGGKQTRGLEFLFEGQQFKVREDSLMTTGVLIILIVIDELFSL